MSQAKAPLDEPHGTVLYIEDQEINSLLVEAQLATTLPGVKLIKAATGVDGVRLARSEHPDLVLLDMHLPDLGGLEVVRALTIEISEGLNVTLLTGDQLSMDILKAMSLGAHEYWVKPLSASQLEKGVRRALGAPMLDAATWPPQSRHEANHKASH